MTFNPEEFASGDTEYIQKHNSNYADIARYLNPALQDIDAIKSGMSAGADLDFRQIADNLLINGGFQWWQRGITSKPDRWEIENQAVGFTVERSTAQVEQATFSAKVMNIGELTQIIREEVRLSFETTMAMSFAIQCWCSETDCAKIGIYDGLVTQWSEHHPGNSNFEKLHVRYTQGAGAIPTQFKFILKVEKNTTVYWNAGVAIRGNPYAPPLYISNDLTLEEIIVLSYLEYGMNGVRGVGQKVGATRANIEDNWITQESAADNDWRSVCWSPELNLFVAVAYSGAGNRVMTSPDGVAWTIRTSAVDNAWLSVCWSPELNLFVAVAFTGTGNRVMTSPNGITWTARTSAADNQWFSVCWSPELTLFVAVAGSGYSNRVMTSPDGITWTARTSAADNQWASVCWSPELTLFVAVAGTGSSNRVMTSPDGITWTIRTSAADNFWSSVCWSPSLSLFVAVAYTGTGNRVMTSPDGVNWTIRSTPVDNQWISVVWSPSLSLFVAVADSGAGNRVMTSPNGINWTARTSAADNLWGSVCWSPELSMFVVVGYSGIGNRVMTASQVSPLNDRVIERRVNFMAPKRAIPTVVVTAGEETGYEIEAVDISRYGFQMKVTEIGGDSESDGFDLLGIEWKAEVP